MNRSAIGAVISVAALFTGSTTVLAIDFGRDIQPILTRNCQECHGAELQKGKLRLDQRESAMGVIAPGKPAESELYRRVNLPKGHDDIMPNRGETLSKKEIELLYQWIAKGAVWPDNVQPAKHWAYVSPARPSLPPVTDKTWSRNAIDSFILARLEQEGMSPSREADRTILIRRVYLDLIGLPPSPEEAKAFLGDTSENAYEKAVERLLASPQYGERWARPWLDLARYADSSGYQRDNLWDIWPYRDWVINALNQDLPFDQFTIEQLAGDLLPNATMAQRVATGFNRCVPTNVEAGADQEETRVNQVFDRVNTLGSVWLGSTLECSQCHNHKYDPISQKEYYQLFAFFNNTPKETDLRNPKSTVALKFTGPYLSVASEDIEEQRRALQEKIQQVNARMAEHSKLPEATAKWEEGLKVKASKQDNIHPLKIAGFECTSDSHYEILEDHSVLLPTGGNDSVPNSDVYTVKVQTDLPRITGFRLEALTHPSLPGGGPGRAAEPTPNFILNNLAVKAVPPGKSESEVSPVKLKRAVASHSQARFPVANAIDTNPRSGWAIGPEFSKDHWAQFETVQPVELPSGGTLVFRLEQKGPAGRSIGRLRLSALTGVVDPTAVPADISQIVNLPATERSEAQKQRLTGYREANDPALAEWKRERTRLENQLKAIPQPQTLVMKELSDSRMSTVFTRGNFLTPGETVQAATPAVLHPLGDGPPNRLTLARWLVSTNNPLVARVTVNRWWAEFFGQGLVTTPEDFGIKGEPPTHPELLDWLATEFMSPAETAGGTVRPWSMKHIHRLIVTSATYRQSSALSPGLLEKDDKNKLYARGPRFRMEAEMIRDNALAVSGLLSRKQGGPPVRPYQPPGIWENKVGGDSITYEISEGEDRYRRAIYTVWKRTSPYPSLINFDATERNSCTVKRSRSNTPLQALTLLNDPVYVEAAAALAKRILTEQKTGTVAERIQHAFTLCLNRAPNANEVTVLEMLFQEQLAASRENPSAARKLIDGTKITTSVDVPEFAAWHAVAWALLNLNETITKG